MKRILSLILALALLIGMIPVSAQAATLDNGLVYEVYENHVEITGYSGDAAEVVIPAEIEGKPVTSIGERAFSWCEYLRHVVIPEGVTSIGEYAFRSCESLSSIVIPNSVTHIGDNAFISCSSLTDIVIPENVTSIGDYVFCNCRNLTSIVIPDGVTYIGEQAFAACESLTNLVIPDSVIHIADGAFSGCASLTSLEIPDSVTAIGNSAFWGCTGLTSVFIPNNVASIGYGAFAGCRSLTEICVDQSNPNYSIDDRGVLFNKDKTTLIQAPGAITDSYVIPDSVTHIANSAFSGCENMASIEIPDSVTAIDTGAFAECRSLTSIEIPDGVTAISDWTFSNCINLISIEISDSATSIGGEAFSGCFSLTSINIPEGVTSIGEYAFTSCHSLSTIDLPGSVIFIGKYAFLWCSSLTSIVIPESVTYIGARAFCDCSGLTSIHFMGNAPEFDLDIFSGVTATAYYLAGNDTWTRDMLQNHGGYITWIPYDPNHVHEYTAVVTAPTCAEQGYTTYTCICGDYYVADYVDASGDHEYIAVVTDPTCGSQGYTTYTCSKCGDSYVADYVDALGDHEYTAVVTDPTCGSQGYTTYTCSKCGDSYVADYVDALGDHEYTAVVTDPTCGSQGYTTYTCSKCGDSYRADFVDALGHDFKSGYCTRCLYRSNFEFAVYDDHVEIIGYYRHYDELIELEIPSEYQGKPVTTIGAEAFSWCPARVIYLPDSVTTIRENAFLCCENLRRVELTDSVTSIGDGAFIGCINLASIDLPDNLTSISAKTFLRCNSLSSVDFPKNLTSIGDQAFSACNGLDYLPIPDSVTSIGSEAFSRCEKLYKVVIPGSVTHIGKNAFAYCEKLTDIVIKKGVTAIDDRAFAECDALTRIVLPAGVTSIGESAFYSCDDLSYVSIPDGVISIGNHAFYECKKLTGLKLPDSITSIGESAFENCESLTSLTVPAGVTSIEDWTFQSCYGLTDIVLPDGITTIGEHAFSGCMGLTGIDLPESLTSIGDFAFYHCEGLTSIVIPEGVTTIGRSILSGCSSLTSIVLPESVTSIGILAFSYCPSLSVICFTGNAPVLGDGLFYSTTATAYYPAGNDTWTEDIMHDYGGTITWMAHNPPHMYTAVVTEPTCTERGYTTYTCICGDSYVADYVDVLPHEYEAVVIAPTCTGRGCTTHTCVCGDSYVTDEVEPLGHDYTDGKCSRCFLFDPDNDSIDPSNGRFAPDDVLTRGRLCYALWNFFGSPEPSILNPWVDLKESDDYYKAVLWAVENGITNGISATEFGLDRPVNRAQAATFLWRAFGCPEALGVNPFNDVHDTDFFYQSAPWAYEAGYMSPMDNIDTFKPKSDCLYCHIYWGPDNHTHEYTAVVTAPTCSSQGYTTYTCTCGHRYVSDYVDALPHEYEAVITDPTCTKKGFTTHACVCGDSYVTDEVRPLGHDFVDGICSRCFVHEPNYGEAPSDPGKGMSAPDEALTRRMFFYALWNYFGSPEPISTENPFTDISESDYYYDAVLWAVENGITVGISPTQFGPGGNMARLQAAVFLWRAFGSPEAPTENPFTDIMEGDFYYEAVLWVCEEGYMSHSDDTSMGYWDFTSFDPYEVCQYGHINWVPTKHPHKFTAAVTDPTCTEQGFTTYTCDLCGYSYPAKYVEAWGHDYTDGTCTRCGEADPDYEAPVEPPFTDVPAGAYYEAPVLWAVENGITSGVTENSFNPGGSCLRAQVVTFLWRAAGCPEPADTNNPFTDVKEGNFFYKPVLWAVEQYITSGVSPTEFGSYANCNRAAVVTFLWRAAGCPEPITTNSPFTDVNEGDFFYKPVLWAVEKGITAGLTATTFGPTAECNRAQVVTFLYRAYN